MNILKHTFIESIIYCPSQIYYYFEDEKGQIWCAYVRQRSGPLTLSLFPIKEGDKDLLFNWDKEEIIELSRVYDINGCHNLDKEKEEVKAVEEEVMWFLRQRFPSLTFPDQPKTKKLDI